MEIVSSTLPCRATIKTLLRSRMTSKSDGTTFGMLASNRFDARLSADPDLVHMVGKMFYVWKGNHCLIGWWPHINKFYANAVKWHKLIWCIVFDPRRNIGILLNAMKNINWLVLYSPLLFLYFLTPPIFLILHLTLYLASGPPSISMSRQVSHQGFSASTRLETCPCRTSNTCLPPKSTRFT